MTTLVVVLLGAGVGVGVLLIWRGLAPRPSSVETVLAGLARPGISIEDVAPAGASGFGRIESAARRVVEALGYDARRHNQELELVGRSTERHAFDKLLGGIAGLLVPNLAATALVVLGIPVPIGVIAMFSLATAAAGFLMPDLILRDEAMKRRRAFRHALSSYLDLVNVLLAGGAGIETALHAAADAGDGWGYQTIRAELRRARLTGQSPWDAFAQLGTRFGINEDGRARRQRLPCRVTRRSHPILPRRQGRHAPRPPSRRDRGRGRGSNRTHDRPCRRPVVRLPGLHRLPSRHTDHDSQRAPTLNGVTRPKETTMPLPDPQLLFEYCCARLGIDPHDESGMTTTEVAVITFLLVGAAIVVLGIIYAAAQSNANNIPTPEQPG